MAKMTAGQPGQFGQLALDGVGLIPNRQEAQALLGNPAVSKALGDVGRTVIRPLLEAMRNGGQIVSELLEFVATVCLPAVEAFSTKTHFIEGGKAPGGINLWLGDNFKRIFV